MKNMKLKRLISGTALVGIIAAVAIASREGVDVLIDKLLFTVFFIAVGATLVAVILKKSKKFKF